MNARLSNARSPQDKNPDNREEVDWSSPVSGVHPLTRTQQTVAPRAEGPGADLGPSKSTSVDCTKGRLEADMGPPGVYNRVVSNAGTLSMWKNSAFRICGGTGQHVC